MLSIVEHPRALALARVNGPVDISPDASSAFLTLLLMRSVNCKCTVRDPCKILSCEQEYWCSLYEYFLVDLRTVRNQLLSPCTHLCDFSYSHREQGRCYSLDNDMCDLRGNIGKVKIISCSNVGMNGHWPRAYQGSWKRKTADLHQKALPRYINSDSFSVLDIHSLQYLYLHSGL